MEPGYKVGMLEMTGQTKKDCSGPKTSQKMPGCMWLTPCSMVHANAVIVPEKLGVTWGPADDVVSLLPDFEIAD